jgi:hypothetical protein
MLTVIQFRILSFRLLSKDVKIRMHKTTVLPVVLYCCETWFLTLQKERTLRVFENRVLRGVLGPKREKVAGGRRKLLNEELHNVCVSLNVTRVIKSRRWARHVARMR